VRAPRGPDGRFIPASPGAGLLYVADAAQRSGVPGALRCDPPTGEVVAGGLVWTVDDAGPHAASIGCALAIETAAGPSCQCSS